MLIHFIARIPTIIRAIKGLNEPPKDSFDDNSSVSYFEDLSDDELLNEYKKVKWMNIAFGLDNTTFDENKECVWCNTKSNSKKKNQWKKVKK